MDQEKLNRIVADWSGVFQREYYEFLQTFESSIKPLYIERTNSVTFITMQYKKDLLLHPEPPDAHFLPPSNSAASLRCNTPHRLEC